MKSKIYIVLLPISMDAALAIEKLSKSNAIEDYWTSFVGGLFVKSSLSAREILVLLIGEPNETSHPIFISEISGSYYGLLPADLWSKFGSPKVESLKK